VLKQVGLRHTTLSLVFVTDRKMAEVNWTYLRRRGTTDVLTFPCKKMPKKRGQAPKSKGKKVPVPFFIGEVIISPMRAKMYAKKISVSLAHELARYVCHGVLHLTGERDQSARSRARMRRREDVLLRRYERLIQGVV